MDIIFYMTVACVVCGFLFWALIYCDNFFAHICSVLFLASSAFSAFFIIFLGYLWVASEHRAELINRQLGTQYTREDVFYASEYIDEVREIQRKRIELNGDLITGDK